MKYRISVNNQDSCTVEIFESNANDLATAIFLAGMQMAHNCNPVGPVHVIQAEVMDWTEVDLP